MSEIINKVALSPLVTLNLEELLHPGERVIYDIKDNLFHELILKEKDFRAFVKEHVWSMYDGKNVAIICSADAIVPTWAYMLLASKLQNHANYYVFGDLEALEQALMQQAIAKINPVFSHTFRVAIVKVIFSGLTYRTLHFHTKYKAAEGRRTIVRSKAARASIMRKFEFLS